MSKSKLNTVAVLGKKGVVPSIPPNEECKVAPYFASDGDYFWSDVSSYSPKFPLLDETGLLYDEGLRKPLDGEPIPPESVLRLRIEMGDFPYSFTRYCSYSGSISD